MSSNLFPKSSLNGVGDFNQKSIMSLVNGLIKENYTTWSKPSSWPTLPTVSTSTQQISMSVAVYPTGHYLAFNCAGNYTVNWGDGSASQNYTSGSQSNYTYVYANIPGSPTSDGYKIVTIIITPQSGQNLTSFNCNVKNSTTGLSAYDTQILDLSISMPFGTTITIGGATVFHRSLQRVQITSSAITSLTSFFAGCTGLVTYTINSSANITSMNSFCSGCYNLTFANSFPSQYVTDCGSAFANCYSLVSTGTFKLDSCTNASSMFSSCRKLIYSPTWYFPVCTNFSSMFTTSYSLITAPNYYMPLVTNISSMFSNCQSLKYLPALKMPSVTNMSSFANNCYSLLYVPNFYAPAVTTLNSAFSACGAVKSCYFVFPPTVTDYTNLFLSSVSLTYVPPFTATNATTFSSSFANCYNLTSLTITGSTKAASFNQLALNCSALTSATIDMTGCTDATSAFSGCVQLTSLNITMNNALWMISSTNNNWTTKTIVLSPSGKDAYVGQSTGWIGRLNWNSSAGKWVYCETFTGVAQNTNNLAVTSDGYVFSGVTSTATLYQSKIQANGGLATPTTYTVAANPYIVAAPNGNFIYAFSQSGGNLYYINKSLASNTLLSTGNTMLGGVVSTDNAFLYISTGSGNSLITYTINQSTGAPSGPVTISGLNNPQQMAISPDNNHLYVSNYGASALLVYTRNTVTGVLTLSQTVALTGACNQPVISSDGAFVYVPQTANNILSVFSRNTSTGILTALTTYQLPASPTQIALSPDGAYLHIVCYFSSGTMGVVGSFPRSSSTGLLTSPPSCLNTIASMLGSCGKLTTVPAINLSGVSNTAPTPFASTENSINTNNVYGQLNSISVNAEKQTTASLNNFISRLQRPFNGIGNTLTMSNNPGYGSGSLTGATWTTNSLTVTCTSTAALQVGTAIWGASLNHAVNASWTFNTGSNTVTFSGGTTRINGNRIAFANLTGVTGIGINYPYYIVNATGSSFQLAYSAGGTPIAFDTGGTSTSAFFEVLVTGITNSTTLTISDYPFNTGSSTSLSYVACRYTFAYMNGWIIA